jgi:hypothetical protein
MNWTSGRHLPWIWELNQGPQKWDSTDTNKYPKKISPLYNCLTNKIGCEKNWLNRHPLYMCFPGSGVLDWMHKIQMGFLFFCSLNICLAIFVTSKSKKALKFN